MKTVTIEELLNWTFVHELTKGGGVDGLSNANSAWQQLQGSSWGLVASFAELLTTIDRARPEPGMWIEQGAPHDDAFTVGQAVTALAECEIEFPNGWNPIADWPDTEGLGDAAVKAAVQRFMLRPAEARRSHIITLVMSTAVLNRVPDSYAPVPAMRPVERNGKPAWFLKQTRQDAFGKAYEFEVDGYLQRSKRPHPEAYRKSEFAFDPISDIMGRIDYQVWVAALRHLETTLPMHLIEHRLVHGAPTATPWMENYDGLGLLLSPIDQPAQFKKFSMAC